MKSKTEKEKLKENIRRGYSYDAELEDDEIDSVEICRDKNKITSVIIMTNRYHKGFRVGICNDCGLLTRSAMTVTTPTNDDCDDKHYCEKCTDKMMDEKNMLKERDEFLKNTKKR